MKRVRKVSFERTGIAIAKKPDSLLEFTRSNSPVRATLKNLDVRTSSGRLLILTLVGLLFLNATSLGLRSAYGSTPASFKSADPLARASRQKSKRRAKVKPVRGSRTKPAKVKNPTPVRAGIPATWATETQFSIVNPVHGSTPPQTFFISGVTSSKESRGPPSV
jgi:hypothetical protein